MPRCWRLLDVAQQLIEQPDEVPASLRDHDAYGVQFPERGQAGGWQYDRPGTTVNNMITSGCPDRTGTAR
jgi:hypothetical protein